MILLYFKLIHLFTFLTINSLSASSPELIKCKTETDKQISEILNIKSDEVKWIKAEPSIEGQFWKIKGANIGWWVEVLIKDKQINTLL